VVAAAWSVLGINMILGRVALIAMGVHARTERGGSNAIPTRDA
jgi:hypothetical protein